MNNLHYCKCGSVIKRTSVYNHIRCNKHIEFMLKYIEEKIKLEELEK